MTEARIFLFLFFVLFNIFFCCFKYIFLVYVNQALTTLWSLNIVMEKANVNAPIAPYDLSRQILQEIEQKKTNDIFYSFGSFHIRHIGSLYKISQRCY